MKALSGAPLSTRELRRWFEHYQKASRVARERLVEPSASVCPGPAGKHRAAQRASVCAMARKALRDRSAAHQRVDRSVRKRLPTLRPLSAELMAAVAHLFGRILKPFVRTSSGMPSMILTEIRNSVRVLKAQGQSLREISRLLKLSRNTVRRILREHGAKPPRRRPASRRRWPGSRTPSARARGNVVRVQQLLADRERSAGILQHLDALDQRGGPAQPAAALWRISARPRRGGCSTTPRRTA